MHVRVHPTPTLSQINGLLKVSHRVRDERGLTRLVDEIARIISESLGFATVAINLYRPADGDFEVRAVHGSPAAREALVGSTKPGDAWEPFLVERFNRRGAYFIPHDQFDWERVPSYVPDLPVVDAPDAWHPEDALLVPLHDADGVLLGTISVDEPESGRRPTDEELDALVAFAGHVSAAIETAHDAAAAARDRAALARLLDVSASLVDRESADSVLAAVATGIRDALEFDRVAVCLVTEEGGFVPTGTAGWRPGDPCLDFEIAASDLEALFVPEFELEGCYLIERDVATALVGSGSAYASRYNGVGPFAWRRHWLLVPLFERDGSLAGFVWVDDPLDRMLPSRERLQALRTFANQASVALRAARDFEALSARTRELTALQETAVGLLGRRGLDALLAGIVANACALVGTENGYLYVVDRDTDRLRLATGAGYFEGRMPPPIARGEGLAGQVWETGSSLVVDDYATWALRIDAFEPSLHGSVGVPLLAGDEVVGVLGLVYGDASARFGPAEVSLLERFARLAELAFANARLHAELTQSEALHRSVVDGSTDLIALLDQENRVVLASRSYRDVLGYEPASLVGNFLAELIHPDDLDRGRATVVDETAAEPLTGRMRHRDGSWILVEGTSTPVRSESGELELRVVIARDVTERERLQEELRQAQKMESIGRLAGGIAHDFNNLLTAIRGYAELMLIDCDAGGTPVRDSAEQIARAAERAAALTGQLLAFSRKQVLRPQRLDLNEVVAGMAAMLDRMLGEPIALTTELDPALGHVLADPTQLEQVVLNLAINARDAMRNGGSLVLRTGNVDVDGAPHVVLTVADTGGGMDDETVARIFEPFFTTKGVGEGTGLGLATVHGIVAQSGGSIEVDSAPGGGTTFTVLLPRAD